jgi:hypothetical protein
MAVSDSKDLIGGGCDLINFLIGARRLSNCFCCLRHGFEADLAFRPRCVGVMVAGPSLWLGMVYWFGNRAINESKKGR